MKKGILIISIFAYLILIQNVVYGVCTDSDSNAQYPNGDNPFQQGTAISGDSGTDYCTSNILTEYYCNNPSDTIVSNRAYNCLASFGTTCSNGRCSSAPLTLRFIDPTPQNNEVIHMQSVVINMQLSDSSAFLNKIYLNFNNVNYLLPTFLGCHFENNPNCDLGRLPISDSGLTYSTGKFGSGVVIDSNDRLAYSSTNLNRYQGTVLLWINPIAWTTSNEYYIFDSYSAIQNNRCCGIRILKPASSNTIKVILYTDSNRNGGFSLTYPTSLSSGTWHSLVLTYNNGNLKLYVDGNSPISTTYTGTPAFNQNIFVGTNKDYLRQANAILDEVKIYNSELSNQEIINMLNRETGSYYIRFNNLLPGIYYTINAVAFDSNNNQINSETRTFIVSSGANEEEVGLKIPLRDRFVRSQFDENSLLQVTIITVLVMYTATWLVSLLFKTKQQAKRLKRKRRKRRS